MPAGEAGRGQILAEVLPLFSRRSFCLPADSNMTV